MPLCLINTNIKREDLANDFEERVAKCIAETAQFPLEVSLLFYDILSCCLTLNMPKFFNGIIHLVFLELSIIIF